MNVNRITINVNPNQNNDLGESMNLAEMSGYPYWVLINIVLAITSIIYTTDFGEQKETECETLRIWMALLTTTSTITIFLIRIEKTVFAINKLTNEGKKLSNTLMLLWTPIVMGITHLCIFIISQQCSNILWQYIIGNIIGFYYVTVLIVRLYQITLIIILATKPSYDNYFNNTKTYILIVQYIIINSTTVGIDAHITNRENIERNLQILEPRDVNILVQNVEVANNSAVREHNEKKREIQIRYVKAQEWMIKTKINKLTRTTSEYDIKTNNYDDQNEQNTIGKQNNTLDNVTMVDGKEICPICLEKMKGDVIKTECNHKYHISCMIQNAYSTKKEIKCPMCRKELGTI